MHHLDAAILGVVHQMVLPRNQRLRVIPRDQERVAVIACGRLQWGGQGLRRGAGASAQLRGSAPSRPGQCSVVCCPDCEGRVLCALTLTNPPTHFLGIWAPGCLLTAGQPATNDFQSLGSPERAWPRRRETL